METSMHDTRSRFRGCNRIRRAPTPHARFPLAVGPDAGGPACPDASDADTLRVSR
jgi:hypothetical protein